MVAFDAHCIFPFFSATSSQSDHYQFASRFNGLHSCLPPFTWTNGSERNQSVSVHQNSQWPFLARLIFAEMEEPKPAIMNANVSALGKQSSSGAILLEDKDDTIDLDADDMIDLDAFTTASDPELGANLSVLNDLGFTDDPQSMKLLNECHGDLNLVIAHYCKMADDDKDEDEDEGGFVSIAYGSTTSWSQSSSRKRKTNPARQRKRSACGKFLSGVIAKCARDDCI